MKLFLHNKRIRIIKKELLLNPNNYANLMELGTIYFQKKNYKAALENLIKANRKIDDSAELFLYIGICYIELKQLEEGNKYLLKAVGLNKKAGYGLPYLYLIKHELSSGNIKEEKLKKLEEEMANFSNTENSYRLAVLFRSYGYKDKAKEMFKNALSEYSYCQRKLKRLHRKWAFLARINKSPVLSALTAAGISTALVFIFVFIIRMNEKKPIDFNAFPYQTSVGIHTELSSVDKIISAYNTYFAIAHDKSLYSEATMAEAALEITGIGSFKTKEELLEILPAVNNQLKLGYISLKEGKVIKPELLKTVLYIEPDYGRIVIAGGGPLQYFYESKFSLLLKGVNQARIKFVLRFEPGDYSRAPDLNKRGVSFSGKIENGKLIIEESGGDLFSQNQIDLLINGADLIERFNGITRFPYNHIFYSMNEAKEFLLLYSTVTPFTIIMPDDKGIEVDVKMKRSVINRIDRREVFAQILSYMRYGKLFLFN